MYAVFDIGGTKTRVAVSEDLKKFEMPIVYDTPESYDEGASRLIETIRELADDVSITACAGGVRGVLQHDRGGIQSDSILTDWVGKPLRERLSQELDTPVYLENDTALVGLGEAHHGAGIAEGIMAYHTVSTGVGGVRIVDGEIAPSEDGFEPGHQILDMDRSILGEDIPHTLENLVSGTALEKRRGVKPYEISQEDPVWNELARYLGFGLKNTILYWSPQQIVLGGSMIIGDPRILLSDIQKYTAEALGEGHSMPEMVLASLEDKGGLYGAMVLLHQKMA